VLEYISTPALTKAYENTTLDDHLRDLLAEGFHDHGDYDDDEILKALLKEFMIDVLRKAFDHKRLGYGPWEEPCKYYQHANKQEREPCEIRVDMAFQKWKRESGIRSISGMSKDVSGSAG
jgi:hypothetical protein